MKSLYIKNYKNLRELSIDSLARVNLIVGCNNVGCWKLFPFIWQTGMTNG